MSIMIGMISLFALVSAMLAYALATFRLRGKAEPRETDREQLEKLTKDLYTAFRGIAQEGRLPTEEKLSRFYSNYETFCDRHDMTPSKRLFVKLLADYHHDYDSLPEYRFKQKYVLGRDERAREGDTAYEMLVQAKKTLPFPDLPPKESEIFTKLEEGLENEEYARARDHLSDLAAAVAVLHADYEAEKRRTRVSTMLTILGVGLTTAFGTISILQIVVNLF